MTTLTGKELLDYLDYLEIEVRKMKGGGDRSLADLMHNQMADLIEAEKRFLAYVNSNGTQPVLSISSNGLPSVQSLNPDLEKMCELAEEEKSLNDVAQRFRKGMKGKNNDGEEKHLYVPVSEKEWETELKNYKPEQLLSQVGFAVSETEEGKFELALREDLFLKGYDQHSKEFPVLIREGKTQYRVVWNRLIDCSEERFYVPNTASVLKGKPTISLIRAFNDLERYYPFRKRDYKSYGERMPWMFWGSWIPKNYAQFLNAGTGARTAIANSILETLGESLGKQVSLKGIRKNDLEVTMAFSSIPFGNSPKTTPKDEDLYELNEHGYILRGKFPTEFDLVHIGEARKIGTVDYFLPRKAVHFDTGDYNINTNRYDGKHRNGYKFTLGRVKLHISGSAISNESQFEKLQDGLEKIKKRY